VSTPAWAPDVVVDEVLAAQLVRTQFPDLADLPVRPFAAGWDNAVFSVGPDLVFRFVHRAIAVPLAERELVVLPALAGRLPLRVPVPTYVGHPVPEFDRPFWGGPLIPGVELAHAGLDAVARVPAAAAIGAFLRALHAPGVADHVVAVAREHRAALPVDPNRRSEPLVLRERAGARVRRLRDAGADVDADALLAVLDAAVAVGRSDRRPVLLHGDLHVRHVLVSPDGVATGVIDWGDTGLGDPAVDLMIGYAAFVGPARRAFLDAYGPVEPGSAERARAVAVNGCTALLESIDDADGDAALAAEVRAALSRVLE
jgi:aminoglycoside phosphotransferase (APT) family kinase protein